jgi:plastocyanin domain-containing protein
VVLAITRTTEGNCGGRIVFPGLGIEREIAPGGTVVVRLPAQRRGEVRFGCGMGMYRGSVVAVGGAGIE